MLSTCTQEIWAVISTWHPVTLRGQSSRSRGYQMRYGGVCRSAECLANDAEKAKVKLLTTSCLLVYWLKSLRTSSAYATNTFCIVCNQQQRNRTHQISPSQPPSSAQLIIITSGLYRGAEFGWNLGYLWLSCFYRHSGIHTTCHRAVMLKNNVIHKTGST